jgi:hypothetical protein
MPPSSIGKFPRILSAYLVASETPGDIHTYSVIYDNGRAGYVRAHPSFWTPEMERAIARQHLFAVR